MTLSFWISFILFTVVRSGVDSYPTESSTCQLKSTLSAQLIPQFFSDNELILPKRHLKDGSWTVDISSQGFRVECPGWGNRLRNFGIKSLSATCGPNGKIRTEYGLKTLDELLCVKPRAATAIRCGTCDNGEGKATKICINLSENNGETYYWICHDETRSETVYVVSDINGLLLGDSVPINRPSFSEGDFYPDISADKCYTQAEQTNTVAELLNSETLANQYIKPTQNLFMARGHMMPNGDGIYENEKKSTFFFVNVVPQWQTFNGGNWERLESAAREYAGEKSVVLKVYTGAHGVATLKDENNNDVEIWLGKTSDGTLVKKVPAPRLMWKVLHDPSAKSAVAIIQLNNPYPENHLEADKNLCSDKCDDLSWVNWDTENAKLGLTFCCDVASFYKAVPNVPNLGNLPLLDY